MKSTRFTDLGYKRIKANFWIVYDLTNEYPAQIGTPYNTEKELLSDLERFATERGYQ